MFYPYLSGLVRKRKQIQIMFLYFKSKFANVNLRNIKICTFCVKTNVSSYLYVRQFKIDL